MSRHGFKGQFFVDSLGEHMESCIHVFLGIIGCLSTEESKTFLKMFGDWSEAIHGDDDGKEMKIRQCILDFLGTKQTYLVKELFAADEKNEADA